MEANYTSALESAIRTIRAARQADAQATAQGNTTDGQYYSILAAAAYDEASRTLCEIARATHREAEARRATAAAKQATRQQQQHAEKDLFADLAECPEADRTLAEQRAEAAAENQTAAERREAPDTLTPTQRAERAIKATAAAKERLATLKGQLRSTEQQRNALKGHATRAHAQWQMLADSGRTEDAAYWAQRAKTYLRQAAEAEEEIASLRDLIRELSE